MSIEFNYLNGWFSSFSFSLLWMFISTADFTAAPEHRGRDAFFSPTPQMATCKPNVVVI
jgi:hypothetical protein